MQLLDLIHDLLLALSGGFDGVNQEDSFKGLRTLLLLGINATLHAFGLLDKVLILESFLKVGVAVVFHLALFVERVDQDQPELHKSKDINFGMEADQGSFLGQSESRFGDISHTRLAFICL